MKLVFTLIISILLVYISLCSQTIYKEIKTAQDVIDNFIISRGGKDILTNIKIVKFEAKYYNKLNEVFDMTRFIGKDFYYQFWGSGDFKITTAYDDKNNSGWEGDGSSVIEFKDDLLKDYHNNSINYWGNYISADKRGVSFILKGKDTINNIEAYVIEVNIDYAYEKTLYFDAKTYDIIRRINHLGYEMNYSDYRPDGSPGIPMPHLFYSVDTIKVISYEFNPKFDSNLLKKP